MCPCSSSSIFFSFRFGVQISTYRAVDNQRSRLLSRLPRPSPTRRLPDRSLPRSSLSECPAPCPTPSYPARFHLVSPALHLDIWHACRQAVCQHQPDSYGRDVPIVRCKECPRTKGVSQCMSHIGFFPSILLTADCAILAHASHFAKCSGCNT